MRKGIISAEFLKNCPKLCGNCVFSQNFHTRKLGEITAYYAVLDQLFSLEYSLFSSDIIVESFKNVNNKQYFNLSYDFLQLDVGNYSFIYDVFTDSEIEEALAKSNIWGVLVTINTVEQYTLYQSKHCTSWRFKANTLKDYFTSAWQAGIRAIKIYTRVISWSIICNIWSQYNLESALSFNQNRFKTKRSRPFWILPKLQMNIKHFHTLGKSSLTQRIKSKYTSENIYLQNRHEDYITFKTIRKSYL